MFALPEKSPEEIKSPYLSEEVYLKKRTPFHAQVAIFKLRAWKFLAHHPMCSEYEDHFFRIGEFGFCIGCSMIYSAIFIYAVLFFAVPTIFRYNYWVTSSLPFAGFGLAIIHRLIGLKNKWTKAFSRFVSGFGIGAYLALIIQTFFIPHRWWLGLILFALLFLGNQLYGISRGRNANREKCRTCPLHLNNSCDPERNTNIRVRKVYAIVEEELEKAQQQVAQKRNKKENKTLREKA